MRKLIESTLVSLDGVTGAPERWASFDAEDTAYSLERRQGIGYWARGVRETRISIGTGQIRAGPHRIRR